MLNHVPRPLLQRVAGWAVPAAGLFYKGRGVECPVCGSRYRRFMPYGYVQSRANALCPKCLSLERHRLLWLYLTRETDLLTSFPRTLHIAPEVCIMRHLKPHFKGHPGQYVTADLESPLADLHFDVQQIPLRTIRPPPHLRRGLHRPAARSGLRGRGHRLRRDLLRGRTPALRPAERPYLRRLQALRQTGMRSLRVSTKTPRNSGFGAFSPYCPYQLSTEKTRFP